MKSKRILILANFDVGLYKFRKELIQSILEDGCEVWISLPEGDMVKPLVDMGCSFLNTPVDRRGVNPFKDRMLIRQYEAIVDDVKPDAMISYTIKPNIYGGMVCSKKNIPYFANITGLGTAFQKSGVLRTLVTMLYKKALKNAKAVFFENEDNFKVLRDFGIVNGSRAVLLSGAGVNLDEYYFSEYPPEEEANFLFIGRIMKEKGIDEFLYAARRLREKFGERVRFEVAGPYEDDYKEIIENAATERLINFHGFVSEVRPLIEKAHAFVLPSYHEGMSNTLLENAAMGRPLITSDIPGCREAVEDGRSGFLVKAKDGDSLYEKMLEFVELPYDKKKEMGARSRRLMEERFDKIDVVERTKRVIYRGLAFTIKKQGKQEKND